MKKGQLHQFLQKKSSFGADVQKTMRLLAGDYVLLKNPSRSTQSLMNEFKKIPEVAYTEPNFIYQSLSK